MSDWRDSLNSFTKKFGAQRKKAAASRGEPVTDQTTKPVSAPASKAAEADSQAPKPIAEPMPTHESEPEQENAQALAVAESTVQVQRVQPRGQLVQAESRPGSGVSAVQAKYAAEALVLQRPSADEEKLMASLSGATIDLNPHQIDAALFAFRSPLSNGAILADEVGLGKTIEAGLVMSQKWAEKRRRILVISPTSLRKQWAQELEEKFFLPTAVLDGPTYNAKVSAGVERPFEEGPQVTICSFHFAWNKEDEIRDVPWDLVVIDEAHRLRNVYKSGNKIASSIKRAIGPSPKILLTATPLQNNVLELYGLVSFVDEHVFGNLPAFRAQFNRLQLDSDEFADLRQRLRPICHRTLRSQVTEFIRFTSRIPLTQDFVPTEEEQRLYDGISDYLQREDTIAMPSGQRQLITLVMRKLLASSTFAIAGTLEKLVNRLESSKKPMQSIPLEGLSDYEEIDELHEEWQEPASPLAPADLEVKLEAEIEELRGYLNLATSIQHNAKADALLEALEKGFDKLSGLGAARKAVIFTESLRSQQYLAEFLVDNGFAGGVITFNGSNNDAESKRIYEDWLRRHADDGQISGSRQVDVRAALVEEFRDRGEILIATEAGAEGINLQFASLIVNYDMPWNPQRVEQRIGRCHRYGQKHDVVVINFINRANAADVRVFELLSEKFHLFNGVFGSSDEILGSLESGVDFERRISDIYNQCRTPAEIDEAFDSLQAELDDLIQSRMGETRQALLEHFDEEVHARFNDHQSSTISSIDKFQRWIWTAARYELDGAAEFDLDNFEFELGTPPNWAGASPPGRYHMVRRGGDLDVGHVLRLSHPLVDAIVEQNQQRNLAPTRVVFDYTSSPTKVTAVEELVGKSGWLRLHRVTVDSLEQEQHFLWVAQTDGGEWLDSEDCEKLMTVPARDDGTVETPADVVAAFDEALMREQGELLQAIEMRNSEYFELEMDKMDRWANDLKVGLEQELKDLDMEIAQAKKDARAALSLQDKVAGQRIVKELEAKRTNKRREFFDSQDNVDQKKDAIIDDIAGKLAQSASVEELFAIQWRVA